MLGVEAGEVLVEVTVVAVIVAKAMDLIVEAKTMMSKMEMSVQSYTKDVWGQLIYEQKESVKKCGSAFEQKGSPVSSITIQNNNELGNQSSVTHDGNQLAKVRLWKQKSALHDPWL